MKRLKVNTTWEEDENEQRHYFAGLSYSERLSAFFILRNATNPQKKITGERLPFKVYHSHEEAQKDQNK